MEVSFFRPAAAQHTLLGYFQSTLHLLWPPSESSERVVKSYGRHGLVPVSITRPLCPHTSHQFCFALLSKLILRFYFFIYPFSTLYYLSVPPVLHPPKSVTCAHTIILHWGLSKKKVDLHILLNLHTQATLPHTSRGEGGKKYRCLQFTFNSWSTPSSLFEVHAS